MSRVYHKGFFVSLVTPLHDAPPEPGQAKPHLPKYRHTVAMPRLNVAIQAVVGHVGLGANKPGNVHRPVLHVDVGPG